MKTIVAFAFYFLYWLVCFLCTGTDRKNLAGLRSYPDAVQAAVRARPELKSTVKQKEPLALILLGNLVLFTAVFSSLGLALKSVLGLRSFWTAFCFFLALGEGLGLFDLLVIDLLWWRNSRRVRFSFLPERQYYQNPDKHVASFLRGIPLFAVVALLTAAIVSGV